ncbi:MAG: sulfatase [Actinomycetota bacterium]
MGHYRVYDPSQALNRGARTHRASVVTLAIFVYLAANVPQAQSADPRPNVVLVITDDQDIPTLAAMPKLQELVADEGVTFTSAFAVNSLCCPSRASIFTGNFSHTHRVYGNVFAQLGGWRAFYENGNEDKTIAKVLDDAGYHTGLVGKYLNEYDISGDVTGIPNYIPPGWDEWNAFYEDNARFYDYDLNENGTIVAYGSEPGDYSGDVLNTKSTDFIAGAPDEQPLFLVYSPNAPHGPYTPSPEYEDASTGIDWKWSPAFNEKDVSDKPGYIRRLPRLRENQVDRFERLREAAAVSLMTVDDGIEAMVESLEADDRLENTMIIVMGDNAFSWGDHRWVYKIAPYESSIKIPFIIRFPPSFPAATEESALVANVDIAPTIADVSGVALDADGESLLPLVTGDVEALRDALLIEHRGLGPTLDVAGDVPSFCAIRTNNALFVRYTGGFEELYRLQRDPFELENRAPDAKRHARTFRKQTRELCEPLPPGMNPF